jgi:hypothetical protein
MCISETHQQQLDANVQIDRACTGNGGDCVEVAVVDVAVQMSTGQAVQLRLCTSHAIQITQHGLRNGAPYSVTKLD